MSARALRRLRQEREESLLPTVGDDEEESSDDDDVGATTVKKAAFISMLDSDDEDEESEESEGSNESTSDNQQENSTNNLKEDDSPKEQDLQDPSATAPAAQKKDATILPEEPDPAQEGGEDLDMLIAEFQNQDSKASHSESNQTANGFDSFPSILEGLDVRDLDIDYVSRTSLFGNSDEPTTRIQRKKRQVFLFGPPRDGWIRPPHYVGGGIGMTTYDIEPHPLPWPYSDDQFSEMADPKRWFTFQYSDSYQQDCRDYQLIQESGELNALALFVAHHPFVTDALVQFAMALYSTNHHQEGLSILRRALWIYECSTLPSFTRFDDDGITLPLMDYEQEANACYFKALFRLIHVSNASGLVRACLAVSRYLLAMDPLRDPMGILLAIDFFALATGVELHCKWIVQLVESQEVRVLYHDESSQKEYSCELVELPNWSFSYAFALFRLHRSNPSDELEERANAALQLAIKKFPAVVGLLLQENGVDVTGRSFQMDWPPVLEHLTNLMSVDVALTTDVDPVVRQCTLQAFDSIIRIFVQQQHKLWGEEHVLRWIYNNVASLQSQSDNSLTGFLPSPALMRYANSDPSNYENRIRHLPADLNLIDNGLVAHAMVMQPNRPRLLQRGMRQQGDLLEEIDGGGAAFHNRHGLLGPPSDVVDPDWPIAEVFWRSLLPWNRVDGIPPPRR